jgi:DNA helicase-2/ATP-dependent DNA helicase PcrA
MSLISLLNNGIPYVIVGGISFYQRREIKDILSFLRLAVSGSDYIAFARTINLPKRGIGDASLEKLRRASLENNLPILQLCREVLRGEIKPEGMRINARQRKGLEDYLGVIARLSELASEGRVRMVIDAAISDTGYEQHLKGEEETYDDRKANIYQLSAKAAEWETANPEGSLQTFLEELTLRSTLDETSASDDRVRLMTMHNGKGLEFDVVFLMGLEEGLFPHFNSIKDENAIEEERRICYVGMTRSKKLLYLTYAKVRRLFHEYQSNPPSRFISEIPNQYVSKLNYMTVSY